MELKEVIKKILKKKNISLYRLAKEVDVSYNQAWRWKEGITKKALPVFQKKLKKLLEE